MHKIVLIDDDENIITSLEMVLQSSGFDTNSYTNGLVAIEKVRENVIKQTKWQYERYKLE